MTKPNSFVQVNTATSPGKKLAMYEFPDDNPEEGCPPVVLQSEAVTLTTGRGAELLGPARASHSIPVVVADQPERLHNGGEVAVGTIAVMVLDENHRRRTALVQNTGGANIRVGVRGVTATTGLRLIPNAIEIFDLPDVYLGEVWAVSEGVDSVAFSQETTGATHHFHHRHHRHRHDCDPDCDLEHADVADPHDEAAEDIGD